MENSLIFYHLSRKFTDSETLRFAKLAGAAPGLVQVREALLAAGVRRSVVLAALEKARVAAEHTLEQLARHRQIRWVSFWSGLFPAGLRNLKRPPWVLFFVGEFPRLEVSGLGVVGSRRPTFYGEELVAYFLPRLQTRPLQIFSGLALGVDTLAHRWACECQYPNFAVLAGGLDSVYPRENSVLAERILSQSGGLISEFAPGVAPLPGYFPYRNRIVAGFSDVLWAVQGSMKSGSVHTVNFALELGKRIVVAPGDLFSELSHLPHHLLREGATPIIDAQDLDAVLHQEWDKKTLPLHETSVPVDAMV